MSSTILYKFRSGTTFEALPLPGSAARLFDVKKAIVLAKKLDQGSIEFDLSVRDATTQQEYTDDAMLLPRGARLVVQRLPAAKGHGILAKIARSQHGGAAYGGAAATTASVPNNFYTIGNNDDDDEFISNAPSSEDQELAALRAAQEAANQVTATTTSSFVRGGGGRGGHHGSRLPAGSGGPPRHYHGGSTPSHQPQQHPQQRHHRPNADPELRDQEKQPKKRATGIPRTFISFSAPPNASTDAGDQDSNNAATVPSIQPNKIGFTELLHRSGGQSESASGSKRDLDYALRLTATTVPEYLQCAICQNVVSDAMILPWDPEGRTTCETCIRDALTQNGFRCPLTGLEGVSPDDLLPNTGLRKAAEQFVKKVIEQMEEIEKQQDPEEDDDDAMGVAGGKTSKTLSSLLEGDGIDKGVILSRRASVAEKRKKQEEEDPYGGDDDFGGDVFAVETRAPPEDEDKNENANAVLPTAEESKFLDKPQKSMDANDNDETQNDKAEPPTTDKMSTETSSEKDSPASSKPPPRVDTAAIRAPSPVPPVSEKSPTEHRREQRHRGLPAGYTMGPAGGALGGPREEQPPQGGGYPPRDPPGGRGYSPHGGRGAAGGRHGWKSNSPTMSNGGGAALWNRNDDHGRRGDDVVASQHEHRPHVHSQQQPDEHAHGRGIKRSRSASQDGSHSDVPPVDPYRSRRDDFGRGGGTNIRSDYRGGGGGGRGAYVPRGGGGGRVGEGGFNPRGRGYFRGGRVWDDRGGGRGGYRGGRGRGRY